MLYLRTRSSIRVHISINKIKLYSLFDNRHCQFINNIFMANEIIIADKYDFTLVFFKINNQQLYKYVIICLSVKII